MKGIIGRILLVVGILSLLATGAPAQEIGVSKDKLRIGVFSALTGPYAEYGIMWSQGGKVVFDDVNEKGGVNGRKIEYAVEDDGCDSTKGATAAKKLIYDQKAFGLYGGVCTGVVTATLSDVAADKIPLVVTGAGGSSFAMPWNTGPSAKYVFGGPAVNQFDQGRFIVEFMVSKGWKKLGVIYHPDIWGTECYNGAKSQMEKLGLKFVAEEQIVRDATDSSVQVLKMKEKKPDGVILILYPRIGPIFLRQAHERGFTSNFVAVVGTVSNLDMLRKTAQDEALGNFYYASGLSDLSRGPQLAAWRDKIRKAYPDKAKDPNFPNVYAFYGIGSGIIMAEGLKRAGTEPTREKLIKALEGLKDFDTGVLSSKVTYGPNDHVTNKKGIIVKYTGATEEVIYRP